MTHALPVAGWQSLPLHLHAATHSAHHDLFADTARWMLHMFTGSLAWWAGRRLGEQLGLGAIAAFVLIGGTWWFLRRRARRRTGDLRARESTA